MGIIIGFVFIIFVSREYSVLCNLYALFKTYLLGLLGSAYEGFKGVVGHFRRNFYRLGLLYIYKKKKNVLTPKSTTTVPVLSC